MIFSEAQVLVELDQSKFVLQRHPASEVLGKSVGRLGRLGLFSGMSEPRDGNNLEATVKRVLDPFGGTGTSNLSRSAFIEIVKPIEGSDSSQTCPDSLRVVVFHVLVPKRDFKCPDGVAIEMVPDATDLNTLSELDPTARFAIETYRGPRQE